MAFHGDLSSYPLPELLQWLDASRKTGALQVSAEGANRKLFLLTGQIVATASPGLWERLSRVLDVGSEASGMRVMDGLRSGHLPDSSVDIAVRQLAEEDLLSALGDLTQAHGGRFHWTEDPDRGEDEWVSLDLSLVHAVFETLRRVDESSDVERALPHDTLLVKAVSGPSPTNALQRIVLHLATRQEGLPLSRLWLQLGLSRSLVTRTVYDLLRAHRVVVDGALLLDADPIADMLEKGALLLRERQFDAASLLFATLLQSDPTDRRVREFVRMVDREHAASIYALVPPLTRFVVKADADLRTKLRPEERQVLAQLESHWDVSAVVLASTQRELDTLKTILKLQRMGAIEPTAEAPH